MVRVRIERRVAGDPRRTCMLVGLVGRGDGLSPSACASPMAWTSSPPMVCGPASPVSNASCAESSPGRERPRRSGGVSRGPSSTCARAKKIAARRPGSSRDTAGRRPFGRRGASLGRPTSIERVSPDQAATVEALQTPLCGRPACVSSTRPTFAPFRRSGATTCLTNALRTASHTESQLEAR